MTKKVIAIPGFKLPPPTGGKNKKEASTTEPITNQKTESPPKAVPEPVKAKETKTPEPPVKEEPKKTTEVPETADSLEEEVPEEETLVAGTTLLSDSELQELLGKELEVPSIEEAEPEKKAPAPKKETPTAKKETPVKEEKKKEKKETPTATKKEVPSAKKKETPAAPKKEVTSVNEGLGIVAVASHRNNQGDVQYRIPRDGANDVYTVTCDSSLANIDPDLVKIGDVVRLLEVAHKTPRGSRTAYTLAVHTQYNVNTNEIFDNNEFPVPCYTTISSGALAIEMGKVALTTGITDSLQLAAIVLENKDLAIVGQSTDLGYPVLLTVATDATDVTTDATTDATVATNDDDDTDVATTANETTNA